MATAPTPGGEKTASVFRITVRGRTLELANNISMQEKMALRYATNLPFEAFWSDQSRIGEDSICVLWWLARRANGEPNLSFAAATQEWPDDLTENDLDMTVVGDDGEGDNPES